MKTVVCLSENQAKLIQPAAVLLGLMMLTWVANRLDLDLRLQRLFFDPQNGWIYGDFPLWMWLYRYGTIPGLVLTLTSLVLFYLTFLRASWKQWRRPLLVVVLTTVVGAGILVNGVLKPFWGRPRPRQVAAFGGQWEYRPVQRPGIPGRGQSFPCGHCTMGFVFVSLFYFRRVSTPLAVAGGAAGIAGGTMLGAARTLQGAHFATDVLWSLGVIWITAMLMNDWVIPCGSRRLERFKTLSARRRRLLGTCIFLTAAGVTAAFLSRRPIYETYHHVITPSGPIQHLTVSANIDFEARQIRYTTAQTVEVTVDASGFGWTNASHSLQVSQEMRNGRLSIRLRAVPRGYFSELDHRLLLELPAAYEQTPAVDIQTNPNDRKDPS